MIQMDGVGLGVNALIVGDSVAGALGPEDVSVIIPVRDDLERLVRAMTSVRASAPGVEIIVIDNDSLNPIQWADVSQWASAVHRIAGSLGHIRRLGAELAQRDIIFFLDADQVVLPETIRTAVGALVGFDAVVIAERPLDRQRWLPRITGVERAYAEYAGMGIPRMFTKQAYWRTQGHRDGMMFGEDRSLLSTPLRMVYSEIPILHDEIPDLVTLWKKYRRYGKVSFDRMGAVRGAMPSSNAFAPGVKMPPRPNLWYLPLVLGIKGMKMVALMTGSRFKDHMSAEN